MAPAGSSASIAPGQLLNARRIDGGKVLDDLCIVVGIIVVLAVVSDAVRVGVIRKLDNADSVGHVIVWHPPRFRPLDQ